MEGPSLVLEDRLSNEEVALLKSITEKVWSFSKAHQGKNITLITSGGTSVPLEKRSVRFI